MRRLATATVLLLGACRSKAKPAEPPRDSEPPVVDSAAPPSHRTTLLATPISAGRIEGATVVAARERGGAGWVLSTYFDNAPADPRVSMLEPMPDDSELMIASGDIGLLSREHVEGGSRRILYRVAGAGDAALPVADPIVVGDAVCASLDGIHWLERVGSGWKGQLRPLGAAADVALPGPQFPSQSEITLVCGEHRAFLASNVDGQARIVAWSHGEIADAAPSAFRPVVALPKPPLAGAPDDMLMAAMGDSLALVALQARTLAVAIFRPDEPVTRWQKVTLAGGDDAALESIEPDAGKIGFLILRTVPATKGCRTSDANDTVAEVAIFDVEAGKLVHAPERVETWRCGAEPGPFFSGWAAGKFMIGWPRGADATCSRARVRWGGLGFAVVDAGGARVQHIARPGDSIAEAGCDAHKCYAVVLTRGTDPCGPADGPEAGKLEIVAYPP